jgi:hypothetical protein
MLSLAPVSCTVERVGNLCFNSMLGLFLFSLIRSSVSEGTIELCHEYLMEKGGLSSCCPS